MKSIRDQVLPTDPKAKLQRLLNVSAIVVGYFYVWTYQEFLHMHVALIDVYTLLRLPIIAVVVYPLLKYGYIKQDWLQRGRPTLKSVRFFQLQFPSSYIRERCGRCAESSATCRNFIAPDSRDANSYWLDSIFPLIKRDQSQQADRTFEKGYTCKLVFGLQFVLITFVFISIATVVLKIGTDLAFRQPVSVRVPSQALIFVVICVAVAGSLRLLHRPDLNSPTGCWQAWREINDSLKLWMKNNDEILIDLVCHAGGNNKSFSQRV